MWLVQFAVIFTLISVGIASNFYVNTVSGCGTPIVHRYHGNALLNHVIKTVPLFLADCMTACQETLGCFSINYYKNPSFTCDLNRSTKTQDPGSFVRMTGYEYAEPEKKTYCEGNQCHLKEALPGGWFKLDTSKFKFFPEKKSWDDSKQHCVALGASLASFASQLEHRFVLDTINMTSLWNTTAPSSAENPDTASGGGSSGGITYVAAKMDGTDPSGVLSLFGGASVVDIDVKKAVYFDGVDDYATVPRFDITGDLTIAFWIKAQVANNKYLFVDLDPSTPKTQFRVYVSMNKIAFSIMNKQGNGYITGTIVKSTSDLPLNTWVHVAITWSQSAKVTKMYFNGNNEASHNSGVTDFTSYKTSNQRFEIGAQKQGTRTQLQGWMREFLVEAKALSQEQITALKDNGMSGSPVPAPSVDIGGTWVGLNDLTTEGTFQWSGGTPLTYSQHQSSDNTEEKDCVHLPKGDSSSKWLIAECNQKKAFLCKKN